MLVMKLRSLTGLMMVGLLDITLQLKNKGHFPLLVWLHLELRVNIENLNTLPQQSKAKEFHPCGCIRRVTLADIVLQLTNKMTFSLTRIIALLF
jgi:hypothetical protein